jgi:hypothetical protein
MQLPCADRQGKLRYANPLASQADIEGFRLEGDAHLTFPEGRLRMENARDPGEGQAANFVLWCDEIFPDRFLARWQFWPLREPGLCIAFFGAKGRDGLDLFDPQLPERTGNYRQYHSGEIDTLHVSYFRRKQEDERAFHTCNLRKSRGFHLVAQGADPIPNVEDANPPYTITLLKDGQNVAFGINELLLFTWEDDEAHGPALTEGRMGFRQMAPLIGDYADFRVWDLA